MECDGRMKNASFEVHSQIRIFFSIGISSKTFGCLTWTNASAFYNNLDPIFRQWPFLICSHCEYKFHGISLVKSANWWQRLNFFFHIIQILVYFIYHLFIHSQCLNCCYHFKGFLVSFLTEKLVLSFCLMTIASCLYTIETSVAPLFCSIKIVLVCNRTIDNYII